MAVMLKKAHARQADASTVVQFINATEEGSVPVSAFFKPPLNFPSIENITSFILRNQDNFITNNRSGLLSHSDVIWVKTSLKLCDAHCRKGLTCDGDCECLHVCRNFLLRGSRFCPFSNKKRKPCMFGHNLHSNHNGNLLKTNYLDRLSEEELRTLFCRRTCRSLSTMPQICLYYNGKRGMKCNNKNCKSLHYCIDFLESMCIGMCNRSHTMDTPQNRMVLDLFAIDRSWTEEALRTDLHIVMEHRRESDNSSHYSFSMNDDDDNNSFVTSEDSDEFDMDGASTSRHNGVQDMKGHCCEECRKNKLLVQALMTRVESLERDLSEMKNYVDHSQSRGHVRKQRY